MLKCYIMIDRNNFIIEDLPEDPEDSLFPEDDDVDIETGEIKTNNMNNPWAPQQNPSPWSPPNPQPYQPYQPTFNSSPFTPWQPYRPQPVQQTPVYNQSGQNKIDRRKRVIFCDFLDVLVESESAVKETTYNPNVLSGNNNYMRSGIRPRGSYDIRLKKEIWSKIAAFNPDYVFCITNQPDLSEEGLLKWNMVTDYVMLALSEYLNLPLHNCRCKTKLGFDRESPDVKPGVGLIVKSLRELSAEGYKYKKEDLVILGINSGYSNQSNIDRIMADNAKIDYVDINDLLISYS